MIMIIVWLVYRNKKCAKSLLTNVMLGLVRAGIAGDRSSGGVYCLHPATCNSCTQRTLSCHQYIALSTNRLRIEYDEHAERTYIAEIDEGPNT
jgi:hypothetical protein